MGIYEKLAFTIISAVVVILVWCVSGAGLIEKITATIMAAVVIGLVWWLTNYCNKNK